ncbi:MAG: hypothetical protein Q9201_006154 [Fulgogasparrea decipioides]
MNTIPFSRSHSQSLVYAAVINALTQCGWQPPTASLPYNAQLTGFQLKSLSLSSLTVLQEDLTTLHGSSSERHSLEPGVRDNGVNDNADQPTAVHDAVRKSSNGPSTQHEHQLEDANTQEIIDLCSSPSSSASPRDDGSKTLIRSEERQILSSPSSLSTVNAPNLTRAKVANHTTTKASDITRALGKVVSQRTFSVVKEERNSLQTNTVAAQNNHKQYRALAEAPPLSDVRTTYSPSRPQGRPVAADFFTPHSSPEPGEIRVDPPQYSMKDIEDLIEEEKTKGLRAHQARHAESIRSTFRWPQDTYPNTIGLKRTTSSVLPPNGGLRDGDGRNAKRARHMTEPGDQSYLQHTVSGLTGLSRPH